MINRTFQDIPEDKISEADKQSFLVTLGWSQGTTWRDLLQSRRVLLISEAGAGKTHECRAQKQQLWDAGEPAFFIELAALAAEGLRSLLDAEEEARLDAWLSSQSDMATFFLDSIDELNLTRGSFEVALKSLKKGIGSRLAQVRIVITNRPIPFDEQLVRRVLPVPAAPTSKPSEEAFAEIVMRNHPDHGAGKDSKEANADWRTVALMPLSDEQIMQFAQAQGVDDSSALLDDLRKRNAQEFARRPQDLIELCADWRNHKRIRSHHDQVLANVRIKLQPRNDRAEPAELSIEKAIEGASRLALAAQVTRRLTIRHSAESDAIENEIALDPAMILSDWSLNERKALLERPLFGFASYGRVRFHHRSVAEYLAAYLLHEKRNRGMTFGALKRLLFAETKGRTIVRPSKRPVAGWLALMDTRVFEMLRENEPAVLLDEGDPESLTQQQRNQALRAYVERYGSGGWRGLSVPPIQIHRFASPELADGINGLWNSGIENPDVRQTLLHLIGTGRITECADIAHRVALDQQAEIVERMIALDALVALRDPRLQSIAGAIAAGKDTWPDYAARGAIIRLFPRDLTVEELCQGLGRLSTAERGVGALSRQLPRLIEHAELDSSQLVTLRDGLLALASEGLRWRKEWPHIVSDRSQLRGALAATCTRGIDLCANNSWLSASVLALRLYDRQASIDDASKTLRAKLADLEAEASERLFWAEDRLVQSLHVITDPWKRYAEITLHDGPVELRADRDLTWIKDALSDTDRSIEDRAMLLDAAVRLSPNRDHWRDHVLGLKPLVVDQPELASSIDERLKSSKRNKDHDRWEKKQAERRAKQARRDAKNRASWIQFWREVSQNPETAFSDKRRRQSAWNLWRAMSKEGDDSRASGWNRRFLEEHFGHETADRLRLALMALWRDECPTLASERPEEERNTFLAMWQLGLAGIYAEAEDSEWASNLSEEEAKRAARYAPIELNGLPAWIEGLAATHPGSLDEILGEELTWELEQNADGRGHSMLLQDIGYAPEQVAQLFMPRLREWLDREGGDIHDESGLPIKAERLRQVLGVMVKHGGEEAHTHLVAMARKRLRDNLPSELVIVWLPTLMRLDPELGVAALENRLQKIEPAADSQATAWFSVLFGDLHDAINLRDARFTPGLLLRLLRLAYHHVRPSDDAVHEGGYTPDTRDHAEQARNQIVNALLGAEGEEGWAAKLEMANDPLCAHFKDRILAVAEENWAQEMDSSPFSEAQAVELDKKGEASAATNEAMFGILNDRLDDLDDLLLGDLSPRAAWALYTDEKIMRREIARALSDAANGLYTVDQEAVTADEKETDIRLRSTISDCEAVIELKLADGRSVQDLKNTILDQLVKKYMAAGNTRSGCLLLTLARERKWDHPDGGKRIDLGALMSLLRKEAKRVEEMMGGTLSLSVRLLDLRPRLPVENSG